MSLAPRVGAPGHAFPSINQAVEAIQFPTNQGRQSKDRAVSINFLVEA